MEREWYFVRNGEQRAKYHHRSHDDVECGREVGKEIVGEPTRRCGEQRPSRCDERDRGIHHDERANRRERDEKEQYRSYGNWERRVFVEEPALERSLSVLQPILPGARQKSDHLPNIDPPLGERSPVCLVYVGFYRVMLQLQLDALQ